MPSALMFSQNLNEKRELRERERREGLGKLIYRISQNLNEKRELRELLGLETVV